MDIRIPYFPVLEVFPRVRYGISLREHGTMNLADPNGAANRRKFLRDHACIGNRSVFSSVLEHGKTVFRVTSKPKRSKRIVADGSVTNIADMVLTVTGADCPPIFARDPIKGVFGLAHSGRKGTEANIARELIEVFRSFGSDPKDIYVGVGPGICGLCYTVGEEFAELFRQDDLLRKYVFRMTHWHLNLSGMIRAQLEEVGVLQEHIHVSPLCTYKEQMLYSHRRDKSGLPKTMLAYIYLE